MKFRKRPVIIEAMPFLPDDKHSLGRLINWLTDNEATFALTANELEIETLEDGHDRRARHIASPGDWIIKGVAGEFYPCKPHIFWDTYIPVDA